MSDQDSTPASAPPPGPEGGTPEKTASPGPETGAPGTTSPGVAGPAAAGKPASPGPTPPAKPGAPGKPAPPAKPAGKGKPPEDTDASRRRFLLGVGWGLFTAAMASCGVAMTRFMFPNVLVEPPSVFKIGNPADYQIGEVDERWKERYGIWVVRNTIGLYVLSTVCTHLGCTPNWLLGEDKFKCPCHGSGFYRTGINFEGPAPRPLERFAVSLAPDGQIQVNKNRILQQEKGQWDDPEAFLAVG